jgi:hypothetical protein
MTAAETAAGARRLLVHRMGSGAPTDHSTLRTATSAYALHVSDGAGLVGAWPRAVAVLGRQALEQALDDFWATQVPMMCDVSRHSQLLCLGAYLPVDDVVTGVRVAWHALSRACHHHAYELPPTAEELERWLDAVEALICYDPMGGR